MSTLLDKVASHCGWPSFDVALDNIQISPDPDGIRMKTHCKRCSAHLGHVFTGEHLTAKNTRYCVNSASIDFVNDDSIQDTKDKDYTVVTKLLPTQVFWSAEDYHQDYYTKHAKMPYCHRPIARFDNAI